MTKQQNSQTETQSQKYKENLCHALEQAKDLKEKQEVISAARIELANLITSSAAEQLRLTQNRETYLDAKAHLDNLVQKADKRPSLAFLGLGLISLIVCGALIFGGVLSLTALTVGLLGGAIGFTFVGGLMLGVDKANDRRKQKELPHLQESMQRTEVILDKTGSQLKQDEETITAYKVILDEEEKKLKEDQPATSAPAPRTDKPKSDLNSALSKSSFYTQTPEKVNESQAAASNKKENESTRPLLTSRL